MPIFTWIEDNESRSATIIRRGRRGQSSYIKSWKIFGTSNDSLVHADIAETLWTSFLYWVNPAQPENPLHAESYTLDYLGDDAWQLQVTYVNRGADDETQPDPLRRSRSFDTTGGQQHITQALNNVTVLTSKTGSTTITTAGETIYGTNAPSYNGAIGVDEDSVAGVDIVVPALTWTETYDVPHQYITSGYVKAVCGLTGSVNNNTFRSFAAGEVLFMGCSGTQQWDEQKGDGPWNLSYKFVASPNVTNQTIGSITGIAKRGHDYLWVRYEKDVSSDTLIQKPRAVYVNKVYRDGNFEHLGIGVA